jgi:adenosylhomocysteine nucleosidase
MIGIICAMNIEAEKFISVMENASTQTISGIDFVSGKLCEKDAVVAVCGEGKVASAICAQTMILKYSPDYVINVGVAGGLKAQFKPPLKAGDVVIGTSVVQHDFDVTPLGYLRGQLPSLNKINFKCYIPSYDALKDICTEMGIENIYKGVIASGDQFINTQEKKDFINQWFGAVACDMEGGAIGQACFVNEVPFIALRTISDSADENAAFNFEEFAKTSADLAFEIMIKYIKENLN